MRSSKTRSIFFFSFWAWSGGVKTSPPRATTANRISRIIAPSPGGLSNSLPDPSQVADVDQTGRAVRRGRVLALLQLQGETAQPLGEALRHHAPAAVVVAPVDHLTDRAPAARRQVE